MDTATKQRLIGAAVLVALGAIFLPSLVMGPAPRSGVSDVPMKIPDQPQGDVVTRDLPLVTPAGSTPSGGAVGMDAATPASGRLPMVDTAAENGAPSPDAADAALPPTAAAGDYAVHFGSYATQKDADTIVGQLRAAHLPGYREQATLNGRSAWRVRIGPYTSRADAELAREQAAQVRSDVGARVVTLDADAANPDAATPVAAATPASASASQPAPKPQTPVVTTTPLPPEPTQPKPVSAQQPKPSTPVATASPAPAAAAPAKPAASGVGFAVQLGAFGSAAQADKLRDRARAAGISAYVEQVQTDHGTLSRVRAGPVVERAQADALKAQVKAKLGIDGIVRPQP